MNSGTVLAGNDRIDDHDEGAAGQARDRRDVTDEIETQIVVERRIGEGRGAGHQQRVAVGRRIDHRLGGRIGAGARAIVDHERLAEPVRQPLTDQARIDVEPGAGPEADHDMHRPRRIGLRQARRAAAGSAAAPAARRRNWRRGSFMAYLFGDPEAIPVPARQKGSAGLRLKIVFNF